MNSSAPAYPSTESLIYRNDSTGVNADRTSLYFNATPPNNVAGLPFFSLPVIPPWISACYFVILCMSVFLGIPGNALTVAAYANIKNKSNCDWYILFVALYDLASCAFRNTNFFMEYLGVWRENSNTGYCRFVVWVTQTSLGVSIFVFALIAVDRYIKLCNITRKTITPQKSRNITLILTLINAILAVPCLVIFENISRGVCQLRESLLHNGLVKAYYSVIFALFLVMMVIVVFCYVSIAVKVRQACKVAVTPSIPSTELVYMSDEVVEESSTNTTTIKRLTVAGSSRGFISRTSRHQGEGDKPEVSMSQSLGVTNSHTTIQPVGRDPGVASNQHPDRFLVTHNTASANLQTLRVDVNSNGPTSGDVGVMAGLQAIQARRHFLRRQRNIRVTGLLFVVTAVFILSWIPPYIAMAKGFFVGYELPLKVEDYVLLSYGPNIYIINNFSNPFIYAVMSATYRKHVLVLLRRLKLCPTC